MSSASAEKKGKIKEKTIATAFSWSLSLHEKIQRHQFQLQATWGRKVNFDEAIAHYVSKTTVPAIEAE